MGMRYLGIQRQIFSRNEHIRLWRAPGSHFVSAHCCRSCGRRLLSYYQLTSCYENWLYRWKPVTTSLFFFANDLLRNAIDLVYDVYYFLLIRISFFSRFQISARSWTKTWRRYRHSICVARRIRRFSLEPFN